MSWILEWVSEGVALKLAKGLFGASALIDCHAFVKTDLVALLAESLIASAGVTNCQARRH